MDDSGLYLCAQQYAFTASFSNGTSLIVGGEKAELSYCSGSIDWGMTKWKHVTVKALRFKKGIQSDKGQF